MRFPIVLALLFISHLAGSSITMPSEPPGSEAGQVFVLQDYRWVPVIVHRIPTEVNCNFDVVNGSPTVHAELVSERDFALFVRRHDYETLEMTQTGHSGGFHHMVDTPGRYRVLIVNERGAPPTAVSLVVRTAVDPAPSTISTGISPQRKFVVVLASLTLFFGTVMWSGRKLLRAYKNRP